MAQITFANRGQAAGGQNPVTTALIAQLLKRANATGNIRTVGGGLANTASKLLDTHTAKRLQEKQLAAALAQRQRFGQTVAGALPAAPQGRAAVPAVAPTEGADIGDRASIEGTPGSPAVAAGPDRFAVARALAQSVGQSGNPQAQAVLGAILPSLLDQNKGVPSGFRRTAGGDLKAITGGPQDPSVQGTAAAAKRDPDRQVINRKLARFAEIAGQRKLTPSERAERNSLLESKAAGNPFSSIIREFTQDNPNIKRAPKAKKDSGPGLFDKLMGLLGGE